MSVFQLKDSNGKPTTWVAMVNYRAHDGGHKQIRKNSPRKREAEDIERDFLNRRERLDLPGQLPPPDPEPPALTVSKYLTQWVQTRQGIADATRKRYVELLAPVIRDLGSVPLSELTPLHAEAVYASTMAAGRSAKTALNIHRVLKTAVTDAANKRVIPWNPMNAATAPRAASYEPHVLTRDELDRVFAAADVLDAGDGRSAKVGPLIRLLAWTGLRLGEALALTWKDIDLDFARLSVRQTLNNKGELGKPKTNRSRRTIDLSPSTVALLRNVASWQVEDKATYGPAYANAGIVFANPLGGPRSQSSIDHTWKAISKAAKVPRARVHDLHHAHATHLLADGWEVSAVAERLGHSLASTTLNIYAHALPRRSAEMAQAIDRILGTPIESKD